MNDFQQQQLADLRARVNRIDVKYDRPQPVTERRDGVADDATEPLRYIEEWLSGTEVETEFGRHFETEKLYESHRRHGSADIGALNDLPRDLLASLSDESLPPAHPSEWAFLDTETTGLAGGTGTCAFLIGVGRIGPEGFRVRQFFLRDQSEEASALDALARHLQPFRVMITYNGRAYDQPLLETRYRLHRARPPFARMEHLDLLYGARRLWKLRFESCRLVDLENQVLGVERQGDLPGALIPYVYFDYLRTRQAARLLPVFQHNATDILTLACHLAALERKLGGDEAAVSLWTDLAAAKNPFRVRALEELAKHHEHRTKDRELALRFTRQARMLQDSAELARREARLLTPRVARRGGKRQHSGSRAAD